MKEKERKLQEEATGQQQETAGSDLKALMTNQFTEQVGLMHADDQVHEKRMQEFINEKMGVIQGGTRDDDPLELFGKKGEDQLYLIADTHNVDVKRDDGTTGNAAPLFMNTGLAEVALPVDFRLRNIERTADATAEIQAKRDGIYHRRTLPGMFNNDQAIYYQHLLPQVEENSAMESTLISQRAAGGTEVPLP